jgi:capsular polysaccharide export protein
MLNHAWKEMGEKPQYIGWGYKRSGRKARLEAARRSTPFLLLEDGFLRSVEREGPPLSLVIDDLGIYYDCQHPSRLECLILEPLDQGETGRAQALIHAWRRARASKYNHARDYAGVLPERYVLVCDQTVGDLSVQHGGADASDFRRMLEAALSENAACPVLVKTHPDVIMGRKRGYLDADVGSIDPRIHLIAEDCHAASLLEKAEAVYTVTSQMGFEALLWGKKVRCFGMPFYAGWGLTSDDQEAPSRRGPVSFEQLVHAALVRYPRYVDPETGERCEVERALAHVELQRRMRGRFPPVVHAVGFSRWKRPILKRFLAGSEVVFARTPRQVPEGAAVALWGRADSGSLPCAARPICLEDGFLRSVGLGADFTQPISWVCDDEGLYYDASRPSRLERILADEVFSDTLLQRAQRLRALVLACGITKYNLDVAARPAHWRRPDAARHVILVAGQVEDDASLRHGAPEIKRNGELLRAVRKLNPGSYIVYKPHPDVVAGLRRWGREEKSASNWCDEIVLHEPIGRLFEQADEVHTLTSLAGFEALLRGKPVTCHGLPFYAGWGLTTDMVSTPRRSRLLTLDELVAGALILYPSYVSRVTGQFTTPERAVEELIAWRAEGEKLPSVRRLLRPILSFGKRLHRRCNDTLARAAGLTHGG